MFWDRWQINEGVHFSSLLLQRFENFFLWAQSCSFWRPSQFSPLCAKCVKNFAISFLVKSLPTRPIFSTTTSFFGPIGHLRRLQFLFAKKISQKVGLLFARKGLLGWNLLFSTKEQKTVVMITLIDLSRSTIEIDSWQNKILNSGRSIVSWEISCSEKTLVTSFAWKLLAFSEKCKWIEVQYKTHLDFYLRFSVLNESRKVQKCRRNESRKVCYSALSPAVQFHFGKETLLLLRSGKNFLHIFEIQKCCQREKGRLETSFVRTCADLEKSLEIR